MAAHQRMRLDKKIIALENIEDSIKGRQNAFKHVSGKWLKVTFKHEGDRIIVITAIDKNK